MRQLSTRLIANVRLRKATGLCINQMIEVYRQAVRNEVRKVVRREVELIAVDLALSDTVVEATDRCVRVELDCLGPMFFSLKEPNKAPRKRPMRSKEHTLSKGMQLMCSMQEEVRAAVRLIKGIWMR